MKDLIERLEKATKGSFELNRAVQDWFREQPEGYDCGDDEIPDWTGSIDSALTLVPEGWEWQVSNRARAPHAGRAYIHNRELIGAGVGHLARNPKYRGEECTAATPALALCIVSLRARSAA